MKVLITGASRGIGREIAREMAPLADTLILVARSSGLLNELRSELAVEASDCKVMIEASDVTDASEVVRLFERVADEAEGLDVLINCAGLAIPSTSIRETSLEVWNRIFAVNVTAPFLLTQAAIPHLRRSERAVIVNVASTAALSARPGWSAYAASKAALVNFSNTMAEELQPDKISVHCIAPGRTATDLRRLLSPDEDPGTIMQPESVARIVRFLVTEDGEVLRGQTLLIRGE